MADNDLSHHERVRLDALDRAINSTYDEKEYATEKIVDKAKAYENFIRGEGNNG